MEFRAQVAPWFMATGAGTRQRTHGGAALCLVAAIQVATWQGNYFGEWSFLSERT